MRLSFSAGVKSKRIPQGVKKNPGNHFALHKSGWAVASQIESNVPAQRRNAEKGVLERLELVEHWIGKRAAVLSPYADRRAGHVAILSLSVWRMERAPLEHHKPLWIADRQGAKKCRVDEAEDGGVGADAEGKGEDGDGGEARGFAQHAKGEAQILEQCVEEGQGAGFAVFFSGLLCSAEAEEGLAAGLGGSEAALEIFFDGEFEVGGHFGVEFAVELCAAEKEWRRWEVCRSQVIICFRSESRFHSLAQLDTDRPRAEYQPRIPRANTAIGMTP